MMSLARSGDGPPREDAPAEAWAADLSEVVDAGFEAVDLADTWVGVGDLAEHRVDELAAVVREAGLRVPCISTTRRSVVDPERGAEHLRTAHLTLDRAAALGATVVNLGFMTDLTPAQLEAHWFWLEPGHQDDPDLRELAVQRVRELARHASEVGVELSLEVYEDTFLGSAELAVRFLHDVDHEAVGLNPDLANLVRLHRPLDPVPPMLELVLPHTNLWHVKNYLRDEDPRTGAVTTAPTALVSGFIDYRTAIARAVELGFAGPLVCEHYGGDSLGVAALNREYLAGVLRSAARRRDARTASLVGTESGRAER